MTDREPALGAELRELDPQPAVVVRVSAPTPSLGELFELHLPNIADRIADLGGEPAGPAFARYHDYSAERVDLEIGIPVVAPLANLRPVEEAEPGEVAASHRRAVGLRSPSIAAPTRRSAPPTTPWRHGSGATD